MTEQKTILDATKQGVVNSVDYTRPVRDASFSDLGLLGPQPNIIGGAQIGVTGADETNIYDGQYSAGGSILDALLDAPMQQPIVPKRDTAPQPISQQEIQQAQQGRGGEDWYQTLFDKQPAFRGFILGALLVAVIVPLIDKIK